jgi:uncharacterized membrane protein (UPF0136 family)
MTSPSSPGARAGGFILAATIMIGGVIGGLQGQASAGVVAGFVIGTIAALAVWLLDRRRG